MKKLSLAILAVLFLFSGDALAASKKVKSYYRNDGTYVQQHRRTVPDYTRNNNWSTQGNINPYTGKKGYKQRDNYQYYPEHAW